MTVVNEFAVLKTLYAAMRAGQSIGTAYTTTAHLLGIDRDIGVNIYAAKSMKRLKSQKIIDQICRSAYVKTVIAVQRRAALDIPPT